MGGRVTAHWWWERDRERADKTYPRCPLMIEQERRGTAADTVVTVSRLPVCCGRSICDGAGRQRGMRLRQTCIITPQNEWAKHSSTRQSRQTETVWSLVDHNDVQWPTSSRRLGIKTSRLYSHLLVINSVRAAGR